MENAMDAPAEARDPTVWERMAAAAFPSSPGPDLSRSGYESHLWTRLAQTPLTWLVALVSFVSVPLSFLSDFGTLWFVLASALAAWVWWWFGVFEVREVTDDKPRGRHRYSRTRILVYLLIPVALTSICLTLAYMNIAGLNLWRRDYVSSSIRIARFGSVTKAFDLTAPRTTPSERDRYSRDEWLRWLEAGVKETTPNAMLLFIESEPFAEKFRSFSIEVHAHGNKLNPTYSGAAFLVHDHPGDPWYRPIYREIPCDPSPDAQSRLYRADVQNPDPGEVLWLLLSVSPVSEPVSLDTLDLQLRVR